MGNLLAVVVHAANIHDTKAGILAAKRAVEKYTSIRRFCADAGYRKTFEQDVKETLGLEVDISARIKPEWTILPKIWIYQSGVFDTCGYECKYGKRPINKDFRGVSPSQKSLFQ